MAFLDDANCGFACAFCQTPTADPVEVRLLSFRYLVAFYNVFLKDQPEFRFWLTGAGMAADEASGAVNAETRNGFDPPG
jgi:hypothetical protein